jgi:hypothetical protein
MDQLSEAEDPAAVIAKYQEMGKKPTADMPAFIDPKDGKVKYMDNANASMGQQPQIKTMPSDWIKRYAPDLAAALAAQGGNKAAYGAQEKGGLFGIKGLGDFDKGTSVNTAQAGADTFSAAFVKDIVAKITPLLDKVEKKVGVVASEGLNFKSGIAKVLAESLGYQLDEAEADPDMAELDKLFAQVVDIEDPAVKSLQDRYQKILAKKQETGSSATPGQAATPTPGGPSTQDLTKASGEAGEAVGKKLQRFKELLAKASGKPAATAAAGGAAAGGAAAGAKPPAAGGANPLAADPITANARPKTENMSEAEKYAAIRDRLAQIESRVDNQQVDEIVGALKGAWNAGKGIFQAAKTGLSGAPVATGKLTKTGAAQMTGQGSQKFAKQLATMPAAQRGTYQAAKAVKNNPVKTAIGATAAGAATGYALSGDNPGEAPTPTPVPPTPGPKPSPGPKPTPGPTPTPTPTPGAGALSDEEMKELDALAQSFGDSEDEEILALQKQYSDIVNARNA